MCDDDFDVWEDYDASLSAGQLAELRYGPLGDDETWGTDCTTETLHKRHAVAYTAFGGPGLFTPDKGRDDA